MAPSRELYSETVSIVLHALGKSPLRRKVERVQSRSPDTTPARWKMVSGFAATISARVSRVGGLPLKVPSGTSLAVNCGRSFRPRP